MPRTSKQVATGTPATAPAKYRVRFVEDEDAQFEECNGESRPLTEEEYAQNQYRACPQHPRAGSAEVGVAMGARIVGCRTCGNTQYEDIPYEEYLAYYGNPEMHTYWRSEVQRLCTCCAEWSYVGGTGYIDIMRDEVPWRDVNGWITEEDLGKVPGYLREVAREDIDSARYEAGER